MTTTPIEGLTLLLFCLALLNSIAANTTRDTINKIQPINDGQIIVSAGERFVLGFFSPGNPKNRYVGIWYHKIPRTVVWVANRDNPLTDSLGVLMVNETGILVLLNHNNTVIWSSNLTRSVQNPVARLLDSGNFIVQDSSNNDPNDFLWQSFNYPVDTILAGQKFGRNLKTGLSWYLSSWNTSDDPSQGKYNYQLDPVGYPQFVFREGSVKRFRFGSWNGIQFSGAPQLKQNDIYTFKFVSNEEEMYYIFEPTDKSALHRLVLTTDAHIQRLYWSDEKNDWIEFFRLPGDECDRYAKCGAYASCNMNNFPVCACLDGFVHNTTDIYKDCVRRTSLSCHGDGFLKFSGLKLPDTERSWFDRNISLENCRILCMKNCSCTAYTALDISNGASGCLQWFDKLFDIKMTGSNEDIYIRMAGSEVEAIERKRAHKSKIRKLETVIISCVFGILMLCLTFIIHRWQKTRHRGRRWEGNPERDTRKIIEHKEDLELPLFDMSTIIFATNNFSSDNILGKGGFGLVYKGILDDGTEIAVKRLSKMSSQGLQEFKNEVMHIVKLQHRNLVRLLGCCIQSGERLLVYEFMPNKSLDFFIFDEEKGMLLDCPRRLHIINGIGRGLLYLHQDSRHRIVHRDLKAANVLLDSKMNPKISDFGLARSFGGDEIEAITKEVIGTYGYLPPEYLIDGVYSTKSDVFSFGVLMLEIVSGKRNRGFCHQDNLLAHAWRLFNEGKCSELVDEQIRASLNLSAVLRSIHVGLLCVQLSPEDRPSMSSVVLMLSSQSILPQPKMPGFTGRNLVGKSASSSNYKPCSNEITVTLICGR